MSAPHFDVHGVLRSLSCESNREVFHSEADFQHAFAWEIQKLKPNCKVRLEMKWDGKESLDVFVEDDGLQYGFELKYRTVSSRFTHNEERYNLKKHSALNWGRYGYCKDIWRVEKFVKEHSLKRGYAIFLTNDPSYWGSPENRWESSLDAAFRIHKGRTLKGNLGRLLGKNGKPKKGGSASIELSGTYALEWIPYSKPHGEAPFECLLVQVDSSISGD